ncbi:KAD9 kinase, partial [Heliornis fulica]|nr:KAD9 kinase [Heliornis fulica]
ANTEQVQKDAVEKAITVMKNRLELESQSREPGISEITADHPEVQAIVEEAIKSASVTEVTLSPEIYAEVLERAISELMKNKDRLPGALEKGGWVVDNYPLSVDHWSALSEKGLLPDTVVCLKDTEKDGVCILRRSYLANRDEINSKILKRLTDETLEKEEEKEVRKEIQEIPTSEENQSLVTAEEKGEKITLPEFAEDDFPDIPEMEIIKRKIDIFMHDWQTVESEIKQSSLVQIVVLEIADQTPESLLNQTVLFMEKPFQYHGWELSAEDFDEEAEDLDTDGEDEDEEENED